MNEWIETVRRKLKARIGGDKKQMLIVALGVVGMLLLLLSGGGKKQETATELPDPAQTQAAVARQLEALLKTVDGVGKVKVCVTLERMQADVYAVNTEQVSEPDRSQKSEKYVFTESGNDTHGLRLYSVTGQLLHQCALPHGTDTFLLPMPRLAAGVYALQVDSSESSVAGSTLVRLSARR